MANYRTATYPRATARVMAAVAWLAPSLAAAQEVDAELLGNMTKLVRWSGVVTSFFVIVVAWLVLKFVNQTVDRLSKRFKTYRLSLHKIATIVQFVTYTGVATTVILLSFRLDERVLALVGGTIAVAVGFAVKDVVASFIAGIMIMLDRPFQVGDRVSFGDQYGDITAIGLRSVRMQTLDDNTVTIPNNKFLSDITSCGNYGALDMMVVLDFHVGVDQDVGRAREIVHEAALSSRYVFLPKPVVVLIKSVVVESYFAVRLRLKAYVLDTKFEKAFESDVELRVLTAFRGEGIQPPAILHRSSADLVRSMQAFRDAPSAGDHLDA